MPSPSWRYSAPRAPHGGAQPEAPLGDAPDLVIQNIRVAPASPKPAEVIEITLTVANRGEQKAEERFDVEFLIGFGPPELASLGLGILTGVRIDKQTVTTSIPSGGSVPVTFRWEVLGLPRFRTDRRPGRRAGGDRRGTAVACAAAELGCL